VTANSRGVNCPTPTAHKRLEEVHRFWHECLAAYQDPEEFRIKLNACIQAARNTTFAIQKDKRLVSGFDVWYPAWQAKMKLDPIMMWLQEARRKIVHEGDLETRSVVQVRIIANYGDAARAVMSGLPADPTAHEGTEFHASPGSSLGQIIREVKASPLPARYVAQSTLSIERRWIDDELPNVELMDALAHVHGFLSEMVEDAHAQGGMSHVVEVEHAGKTVRLEKVPGHRGRLPCMVTSRAERTLNLSVKDGQVTTGGLSWTVTPDREEGEKAARRYKARRHPRQVYEMNAVDWLPTYAESARSILKTDDDHGWFVYFFKGRAVRDSRILAARDGADKRALAQEIAEQVALNGYDGIVHIGEVWQSPPHFDHEGYGLPTAEHPDKTEAVVLHAETADGAVGTTLVPFRRRRFGGPVIQEAIQVDSSDLFLAPTRAVWRSWGRSPVKEPEED